MRFLRSGRLEHDDRRTDAGHVFAGRRGFWSSGRRSGRRFCGRAGAGGAGASGGSRGACGRGRSGGGGGRRWRGGVIGRHSDRRGGNHRRGQVVDDFRHLEADHAGRVDVDRRPRFVGRGRFLGGDRSVRGHRR